MKRRRRALVKRVSTAYKENQWAKAVRERDNFTCRWPGCGYYSKSIHAHHINERSQRPDLKLEPMNGAAICPVHHDYLHHTVEGRQQARELGLLGGMTYEKANKAA